MLLPHFVTAFFIVSVVSVGYGDQSVLNESQRHDRASSALGQLLQSYEFKSKVNKTLADWHVPGIAISIVHGDEIFVEVGSLAGML